uniref:Putative secreted protein n=1 Tax=Anopheles darlingi TaxID=43151 RepID=A0A2M4DGF6_ANODA
MFRALVYTNALAFALSLSVLSSLSLSLRSIFPFNMLAAQRTHVSQQTGTVGRFWSFNCVQMYSVVSVCLSRTN